MSNLFNRHLYVTIGDNLKFDKDNYSMWFELKADDGDDTNVALFTVANLNVETLGQIKKNEKIVVEAGYLGFEGIDEPNVDVIFQGKVERIDIETNEVDKMYKIACSVNNEAWYQTRVNKTYPKETKYSTIIRDIAKTLKIPVGKIQLTRDQSYLRGKKFDMSAKKAFKQLEQDSFSKMYFRNNVLNFVPDIITGVDTILVKPINGLIKVTEKEETKTVEEKRTTQRAVKKKETKKSNKKTTEKKKTPKAKISIEKSKVTTKIYTIEMLLYAKIQEGSKIKLEESKVTGTYIVKKVTHKASCEAGSEFTSTLECIELKEK